MQAGASRVLLSPAGDIHHEVQDAESEALEDRLSAHSVDPGETHAPWPCSSIRQKPPRGQGLPGSIPAPSAGHGAGTQ